MAKYGGFGGGGNMQALMRQAQKMQEEMLKAQEELKAMEFVGKASGLVEVTLTGEKTLVNVKIEPTAVDPDDVEMLEDLIKAAFEDAYQQVDEKTEEVMGPYSNLLKGGF